MFTYFSRINEALFNIMQGVIMQVLSSKISDWKLDPQEISDLQNDQHVWVTTYQAYIDPATRSLSNKFAKNDARKKFVTSLTAMLSKNVYGNKAVTAQDLVDMNLPINGVFAAKQLAFDNNLIPVITAFLTATGQVKIKSSARGFAQRGLPSRNYILHIKYAEYGQPLEGAGVYELYSSKSNPEFKINQALTEKRVTFVAQYLSKTGEVSDFGAPVHLFVE